MAPSTHVNPDTAGIGITVHTTDWLWTVFALFVVFDMVAMSWLFMRPRGTRLFHQIAVVILTVSVIAYFSMAADLGYTPIPVEFHRTHAPGTTRQIWYVRYIQWFINAPLVLLLILLATRSTISDILTTLFMSWVLVVAGLIGALVQSSYKWAYFVFGLCALLYLSSWILWHAPRTDFRVGDDVRRAYLGSAGLIFFTWIQYPLVWALSEGGNAISPLGEMVWYSLLDLVSGPVFLFFFLFSIRSVDYVAFWPPAPAVVEKFVQPVVPVTVGAPVNGTVGHTAINGAPAVNGTTIVDGAIVPLRTTGTVNPTPTPTPVIQ